MQNRTVSKQQVRILIILFCFVALLGSMLIYTEETVLGSLFLLSVLPTAEIPPTAIPTTPVPGSTPVPQPCGTIPYGWVKYVIQKGDTLSSLAQKTGTSLDVLREVNCLEGDMIYVGQILFVSRIPATASPSPTLSTPTPKVEKLTATIASSPTPKMVEPTATIASSPTPKMVEPTATIASSPTPKMVEPTTTPASSPTSSKPLGCGILPVLFIVLIYLIRNGYFYH